MPSTVMYSIDFKFLRELSSVQLVHAIIKKYGVERRTMWVSGRLAEVHAYLSVVDPEIARGYDEGSLISTYMLHMFGCLFCFPLSNDILATFSG